MPGIKFTSFYNRAQNPGINFLPYNSGGSFANSPFVDTEGGQLYTQTDSGNVSGFDFDFDGGRYYLGDGNSKVAIGTGISGIAFYGIGIITPITSTGFATHLIVNLNGVDRKIKLNKM